jgi:hypothetical protein
MKLFWANVRARWRDWRRRDQLLSVQIRAVVQS